MSNKNDIICFFDNLHKPLYDLFFKPSFDLYLSQEFNLISIFNDNNNTNGCYQSEHWCDMIVKRFDILRQYIESNLNKWVIFSDIDIIFFNNITQEINTIINNNINIYYMSENYLENKINGGFFIFKCCKETDMFFEEVQKELKSASIKNDQPIIQKLLDQKFIPHGLFDKEMFMTNNNEQSFILSKLYMIKVFHATSAPNTLSKTQVLSSICLSRYNLLKNSGNLWIL